MGRAGQRGQLAYRGLNRAQRENFRLQSLGLNPNPETGDAGGRMP